MELLFPVQLGFEDLEAFVSLGVSDKWWFAFVDLVTSVYRVGGERLLR